MEFIKSIYFLLLLYTMLSVIVMLIILYYKNYLKHKTKRHQRNVKRWSTYLNQLVLEETSDQWIIAKRTRKKLKATKHLMGFLIASQHYLKQADSETTAKFHRYINANKACWVELGHVYAKKTLLHKAYFAYFCEELAMNYPEEYDEMTRHMLAYSQYHSVYCRENALKALYKFGNQTAIIDAFKILSQRKIKHSPKLITDGLLTFKGDHGQLVEDLYQELDQFSLEYQVAILDYFRFKGEALVGRLKYILEDSTMDMDIVCAALRYYRKYPVLEYKALILEWLTNTKGDSWECQSTAAATLGSYPGEDTIAALTESLHSPHWYVRRNAAMSLSGLAPSEESLKAILTGDDVFAKEQLLYHLVNKGVMG